MADASPPRSPRSPRSPRRSPSPRSPNRSRIKVKRELDDDVDDRRDDAKRANTRDTEEVRALESTLRFLVSNNFAGSVIGKAGQVISEFQVQSGAKIVMSRAHEFFPATADRIVLISGTVSAILTALHLILSKLADDPRRVETAREGELDLRIVVPHRVCGAIIGKAGATIRSVFSALN
ncbi:hypothetical protein CLOM_g19165 [Closterium sp. NIES-68]|nr:hypothetical protein CLOM_g19165 [Closterium sp. NIES-68]